MQETINESTGYLIAQVCKSHRNRANELLATLDLHVGQEMFLLQLWQHDGLTMSEMAGSLCVQPATVTRMLERMEKTGLVRRQRDTADHRVCRVFLTPRGRSLRGPVHEVWQQLQEQSLANFTMEERVLLRRFLIQLHENLSVRVMQSEVS